MAITFLGSTGLFTRLGALGGLLKLHASQQADLNSVRHVTLGGYSSRMDLLNTLPAALATFTTTPANFTPAVVTAAQTTLLDMVRSDAPERASSVAVAVSEVIRQMQSHSDSRQRHVPACAVSISMADSPANPNPSLSNVGNGVVIATPRQSTGVQGENIFAEQARLQVTADQRGGRTAGAELFQFVGSAAAATRYGFDWPAGSGVTADVSCCDPASSTTGISPGQNAIANGGYDSWDATPLPVGWAMQAGTAASVVQITDRVRRGAASLGFVSKTAVVQQTTSNLYPATAYGITFSARLPASVASFTSFVAVLEAVDSAGSVVVGSDGSNLTLSCTVQNSDGLNWVTASGTWFTPRVPIAAVRVRLPSYTGDNPASGQPFSLVDDVGITPLLYTYAGGPGLAVFAGVRNWVTGDGFELSIANDRAGADFGYTWQALFDRFFSTRSANLYLPSGNDSGTDLANSIIATDPVI
jgi:hypothetical protein